MPYYRLYRKRKYNKLTKAGAHMRIPAFAYDDVKKFKEDYQHQLKHLKSALYAYYNHEKNPNWEAFLHAHRHRRKPDVLGFLDKVERNVQHAAGEAPLLMG